MLKFINEDDFLKVDTFKENEDGSIAWVYDEGEGLPTHSGIIREGFTRTKEVQTGTETVVVRSEPLLNDENVAVLDENDEVVYQDITEEQPVYTTKTVDVWAKLHELEQTGTVTIQRPTAEDLAARQAEKDLESFRLNRQQALDNAVVTTSLGNEYDADEASIGRLANAILALSGSADDTIIQWSLADTDTGVMTDVSYADLKEAHTLAVQNMALIWGRG